MEPSTLAIATKPLVVNPDADARVAHSAYRVHAIARHLAQGSHAPPERLEEFRDELMEHVGTLRRAGRKDLAIVALEILKAMGS